MTRLSLTRADLQRMLEDRERVTVLDIRRAASRADWFIPGSLHLDVYDAVGRGDTSGLDDIDLPGDRPVVVVCEMGVTSRIAAAHLRRRHGLDARSLDGGMLGWSAAWNLADVPLSDTDTTVVQVRRTGKGCLSYLIASGPEACVIDPALPPDIYLDQARTRDCTITGVLDTHIHADHLSRARRLAEEAGAEIYLPEQNRARFPFRSLRDGDVVEIGGARLETLHTPGHTLESVSYLLNDRAIFTGDTLFTGAVGRPDLEAGAGEAARRHAEALYGSLRRLSDLPPETWVLPAHTSEPIPFDGVPIMATLAEVVTRVAIGADRDAFVRRLLDRLPPPPDNHQAILFYNESGTWPEEGWDQLESGANRCAASVTA